MDSLVHVVLRIRVRSEFAATLLSTELFRRNDQVPPNAAIPGQVVASSDSIGVPSPTLCIACGPGWRGPGQAVIKLRVQLGTRKKIVNSFLAVYAGLRSSQRGCSTP